MVHAFAHRGCVYELFAVLLMARPCRSMRAHAARRPNVFVLGAKPLLQERLPRQASGGPGRPTLDASAAASDASENWASGINLGIMVAAHRPCLVGVRSGLVAVLWARVV